jgi:hypothetical protein
MGKATVVGFQVSETTLAHDSTGVMATACLDTEIGRNTGDPERWPT